jgi:hypothetical protein
MKDGQDSSIAFAVLRHSAADDQLQLRRGSGYPGFATCTLTIRSSPSRLTGLSTDRRLFGELESVDADRESLSDLHDNRDQMSRADEL